MDKQSDVFASHADLLSSLAHPTRLEIIQLLRSQSLNVTQIVQMIGVKQANISQHLSILREADVLESEKLGKESYYRVKHRNITKAIDLMRDVLHVDLPAGEEPTVVDPVCHMELTPKSASHIASFGGVRHYFCGRGCLATYTNSHKGKS